MQKAFHILWINQELQNKADDVINDGGQKDQSLEEDMEEALDAKDIADKGDEVDDKDIVQKVFEKITTILSLQLLTDRK